MQAVQSLEQDLYNQPEVVRLREQLALALRAAAHHGLAEGVCATTSA